jgi:uncharacterized repeat protein (TIGR01451 family)
MKARSVEFLLKIIVILAFVSGMVTPIAENLRVEAASPASQVIPGEIRVDPTYENLGVVWWIEGDDNLNSTFTLEYRAVGDLIWKAAAPGMRAYPTIIVNEDPLELNYWAASALFLSPGQAYDLRLSLTDPDGGSTTETVQGTTRTWPRPDPAGRQLYVIPGSGGGSGSQIDPFQGLQAAADAAIPGDNFQIAPGAYTSFQLLAGGTPGHPIVFQGPASMDAIIDGGGTDRGVVTLGEFNQTLGNVILEGLTIQNGHWGVDAQNTQEIYLHHNFIQDIDFGVYNRRASALESNQTVCDNVILGRTPWPGSGIPGERGIDLRGTGNVVCHNQVRYFGDCVSVQPSTGSAYGNDVYGNDAAYCVDDGIEIDYNQSNARVWRNRVMNARMGVSVQPIYGGPAYIFRNEFFNLESVPVKMHNETTGFYVVHNTGAKHGDGYGDNGAMWRNVVLRNNLFLGTRYAFEFTTIADEGFRDFDYNAWGTNRAIDPGGPFFKWDNVRYDTIPDLPAGVEDHGISAAFDDLLSAALPPSWDVAATPGSKDLRLGSGAVEINSGTHIPNLNDPFVTDGLPDLGAFEYGEPLPAYGPQPLTPDFSASKKQASQIAPSNGQIITYTITLVNQGSPLTGTLSLTDTIPTGLLYNPGTFSASSGSPDDSTAPQLTWTGAVAVHLPIYLTYAVTVTAESPLLITNTVVANAGERVSIILTETILPNGRQYFLPITKK